MILLTSNITSCGASRCVPDNCSTAQLPSGPSSSNRVTRAEDSHTAATVTVGRHLAHRGSLRHRPELQLCRLAPAPAQSHHRPADVPQTPSACRASTPAMTCPPVRPAQRAHRAPRPERHGLNHHTRAVNVTALSSLCSCAVVGTDPSSPAPAIRSVRSPLRSRRAEHMQDYRHSPSSSLLLHCAAAGFPDQPARASSGIRECCRHP